MRGGWDIAAADPEGGEGFCAECGVGGRGAGAWLEGDVSIRCVGWKEKVSMWHGGGDRKGRRGCVGAGRRHTTRAGSVPAGVRAPNGHYRADCTCTIGFGVRRCVSGAMATSRTVCSRRSQCIGGSKSGGRSMWMSERSNDPLGIVLPILC